MSQVDCEIFHKGRRTDVSVFDQVDDGSLHYLRIALLFEGIPEC